jgi:transposase InsO family protein
MGNSMLLVCVDGFSKFVWLLPVREATTASTIKVLKQGVFASFSVPEIIVSDNAKSFVSDEFRRFCFSLGIQHVTTTPYYPNPSHAERFNRNLLAALTAYLATSQTKWDENLQWLQVAFNMAVHESTGKTPFEVIFPFRGNTPFSNRWKILEFLPDKNSPRDIRRRWDGVVGSCVTLGNAWRLNIIGNVSPVLLE